MLLPVHVGLSLVGIATGFVVIWGLINSKALNGLTAVFLATTLLTSLTGFLFPFHGVTPGIIIGVISTVILIVAILARYRFAMFGPWRPIYTIAAVLAQYLNFFVLIVQSFQKIPALNSLGPEPSSPVQAVAHLVALVGFIGLGVLATRRFYTTARFAA
jgi:hypothetical protein